MKLLFLHCVLLCAVCFPSAARAQTNPPANGSRYLLVFDTSSGMKRRAESVRQIAGELIYSGMNGQMRSGDTIGVWTFNETLQAGNLALINWTPERRKQVASKVVEFLNAQKFEKSSRPNVIMPALGPLVANSPKLTVLIFSDGNNPISGTPFDAGINAAYEPFRETQSKERMPFVTVLRAKAGDYLGYAVTPSPWAVEFPQFPPEPVVIAAPKPATNPAPVRPTVAPLIVIGKKTETNAPSDVPTQVLPQPGTETKPAGTQLPADAEKLFQRIAAERGLVPAAGNTTDKPAPAEPSPPNVAVESAELKTVQPKPVEPMPAPVSTAPKPEERKPEEPKPAAPAVTQTNPIPAVQAVVANTGSAGGGLNPLLLIGAGAGVVVVAIGVTYLLMRRRHRAHVSLITSSMDRRQK